MKTPSKPTGHELVSLARTTAFPATRNEIIAAAKRQHCDIATIDFMRMFGPADCFENGIDFISRCEEVALCISEEAETPKEQLRSP